MAEKTSLDSIITAIKALGPADKQVVADVLSALEKAPIDQYRFIMDFWGIEMELQSNGHMLGRMPITPQALNPLGIVHGGITFTLADTAMGVAVWEQYHGTRASVTVETKITYLAPGRGRQLIADVTVLRAGQTLAYTECRIQNDEGRLIATATGTYYVWDPTQKLPD